jgi:hypothetical protein
MTTKTYLIRWDAGCGHSFDVVHTKSEEAAVKWACENWKDEAEGVADYGAELATRENLEAAGFDPEEYLIEENE